MATRHTLPFRQQWLALGMSTISKHYYRKRVMDVMEALEIHQGYPDLADRGARDEFKAGIILVKGQLPKCVRIYLQGPDATPTSQRRVLNALYTLFGKYRAERARQLRLRGYENAEGARGTPAMLEVRKWLMGYGMEGIPDPESYDWLDWLRERREDEETQNGGELQLHFMRLFHGTGH